MIKGISKRDCLILLFSCLFFSALPAQNTPNARQARRIFGEAYEQIYGPHGAEFNYAVNVIGIYKTSGTMWIKGEKHKFIERQCSVWDDGREFYRVNRKKRTVELYNAGSSKKDKLFSKFSFSPDDYDYHISDSCSGYLITLDARPGTRGIKHIKATIDKHTLVPKLLKIKVSFFWAKVTIYGFHKGNIDDHIFHFPRSEFYGYRYIDKRSED
ncbi:MAG: hypothetical protein LKE47_02560 [Prevotella sp.]|jgi:hypothetical protein|nr:hypothetical protein [Prevotella sp.]MCH3985339.1 hypothetical protein [Prevotella sp.]MCH4185554.1 hypothetical protein [Prevotella sp.]MCH4216337.1 hypothetical protein [Prevotella sp.]MCH4251669.1 hypothetical protein [Prevotella sp.]